MKRIRLMGKSKTPGNCFDKGCYYCEDRRGNIDADGDTRSVDRSASARLILDDLMSCLPLKGLKGLSRIVAVVDQPLGVIITAASASQQS